MAADRARLSYDPARRYREVVAQQGRVTLEADVNENTRLLSEATRLLAGDAVGPAGTPDDGYAVTTANDAVQVGPGTYWVGGHRLHCDAGFAHADQPDWADAAADPLWQRQAAPTTPAAAILWVREQEVGAVEQPNLREVALGGPDSAARTRLLERLLLAPRSAATCADLSADIARFWQPLGYRYDAASARLVPDARLRVAFVTTPPPASPCDPPAQSGYLEADNQLIRVQISAYDPATGKGRLLWGHDNASHLHRVSATSGTVVELAARPISSEATPAAGKAVELLRASVAAPGDTVAALCGHVATLVTPYDADTRRVTLPSAMPASYATPAAPLFLRLWDAEVAFERGSPVTLDGTGLAITLDTIGMSIGVGDHWGIALRPFTPNAVYPERLLESPQPPDGPRQWAAPMALLDGAGRGWSVASDCRAHFDNLVELTARRDDCHCTIVVRPGDDLNALVLPDDRQVMLCFEAGTYALEKAVILDSGGKNGHLLLVGAGEATRIIGRAETGIHLRGWASVSVADLAIETSTGDIGPTAIGIRGALTIEACGEVAIERVRLRCAPGSFRASACLRVQNSLDGASGSVRVGGSTMEVGDGGVGVLIVDGGRTYVADNVVRVSDGKTAIGAQGIVVAGSRADDVTIAGNDISGLRQGVHLGLSHRGAARGDIRAYDAIGRAVVTGNTVRVVFDGPGRERHAIFVGHCNSLLVADNRLDCARGERGRAGAEGVRVFGQLGRFMIVRQNHLSGFTTGIRIVPLNPEKENDRRRQQWLVIQNIAENAQRAVDAPPSVADHENLA